MIHQKKKHYQICKNKEDFFKIEERTNGDTSWNGFPVEQLGGNKLKVNEDVYNKSDNLQNVFSNTHIIPLKKLKDKNRQLYDNILESLSFKDYTPIGGETKSTTY